LERGKKGLAGLRLPNREKGRSYEREELGVFSSSERSPEKKKGRTLLIEEEGRVKHL